MGTSVTDLWRVGIVVTVALVAAVGWFLLGAPAADDGVLSPHGDLAAHVAPAPFGHLEVLDAATRRRVWWDDTPGAAGPGWLADGVRLAYLRRRGSETDLVVVDPRHVGELLDVRPLGAALITAARLRWLDDRHVRIEGLAGGPHIFALEDGTLTPTEGGISRRPQS